MLLLRCVVRYYCSKAFHPILWRLYGRKFPKNYPRPFPLFGTILGSRFEKRWRAWVHGRPRPLPQPLMLLLLSCRSERCPCLHMSLGPWRRRLQSWTPRHKDSQPPWKPVSVVLCAYVGRTLNL